MKPLTIKAGKMKDVGSPFRDMTQTEKDYLQSLVDSIHVQFKNDISKNRKVPANSMLNYTDGRIFSGEQAVQYGFADKLGGKEDAVAYLAEKAKISGTPNLIEWPEEKKGFSTFFESKAQNLFKRIPLLGVITKPQLQSGVPYLLPAFWMENLQ
jgi:protease-4